MHLEYVSGGNLFTKFDAASSINVHRCMCAYLSRNSMHVHPCYVIVFLSYKSTKKKLSSSIRCDKTYNYIYMYMYIFIDVYIYLHIAKHIIPLEGSKYTWSNNNKISPEYIYMCIARDPSSCPLLDRRQCSRTFVDRMSERRRGTFHGGGGGGGVSF